MSLKSKLLPYKEKIKSIDHFVGSIRDIYNILETSDVNHNIEPWSLFFDIYDEVVDQPVLENRDLFNKDYLTKMDQDLRIIMMYYSVPIDEFWHKLDHVEQS